MTGREATALFQVKDERHPDRVVTMKVVGRGGNLLIDRL